MRELIFSVVAGSRRQTTGALVPRGKYSRVMLSGARLSRRVHVRGGTCPGHLSYNPKNRGPQAMA